MTLIPMSAQLQDSHILNVKQQRKHFVFKKSSTAPRKNDKPFTKHIMNLSYKILFTIKTGDIYIYMSCQTYLEYIISKLLN